MNWIKNDSYDDDGEVNGGKWLKIKDLTWGNWHQCVM